MSFAVAVVFFMAQSLPGSPYVAGLPFTLTIYAIERGRSISQEPHEYQVAVDTLSACMGAGVPAVIAHWVADHPTKIVLRTKCRIGAPATERLI